jgi:hypothetical protein
MGKLWRAIRVAALASIFAGLSLAAMAQQPASQPPAGGTVVAAEAEVKATVVTYQFDVPVALNRYYRWRGNCYHRNPSGDFVPVAPAYCS